jgi:hypothetical protein
VCHRGTSAAKRYHGAVSRALLPLLLVLPLGCRGTFDLDKYVADAESGTASSADTVEATATSNTGTTTLDESSTTDDTTDTTETETETGTDTDAECMIGLTDIGSACIGLKQLLLTGAGMPTDIEVADFTNDGWLDLLVPGGPVNYFEGLDGGMFGDQIPLIGTSGTALASVYWNDDNFRDLLVINLTDIKPLFSDGTGGFDSAAPYAYGGYDAEFADLDGDAIEDIVLTGTLLRGLKRNGDELIEAYSSMSPAQGLVIANLDDNPSLEIAVAANATNQVIVFLTDGAWGPTGEIQIPFPLVADVAVADVAANVGLELLAVGGQAGELKVLNVQGMAVQETGVFAVGDLPRAVATGDINGDGITDVAVANASSHDVSVLLGERVFLTNEFRLPVDDPNDSPMSIVVADLDNDSYAEIIVGMTNTNRVLVYGHIE